MAHGRCLSGCRGRVRNVRPTQTGLVAKKIGDVTLGLHAHRRYLETHGTPRNFEDLKDHALIGYDQETPAVRSLQARGMRFSRDRFALRTDNDLAHLAAIRCGYGIGVCQTPIGKRDADLVRLLPRYFAFDLEIWLVMHEDLRASPRMRAAFDHLGGALSIYVGGERRTGRAPASALAKLDWRLFCCPDRFFVGARCFRDTEHKLAALQRPRQSESFHPRSGHLAAR
jgi:hypothetical protein